MGKLVVVVEDHLAISATVHPTRGQAQLYHLLRREVPSALPVRLIVDTGSKRTALVPEVLSTLQLLPVGVAHVETSAGTLQTNVYWVRLAFPNNTLNALPEFPVMRLPLPRSLGDFQGIIGRDLLRQWESTLFEGRIGRLILRDSRPKWIRWNRS